VRRILFFALGFLGGLSAVAVLARHLIPSRGDETSDDLALVAIADGVNLTSRAEAFRGGSLRAWMAGVDLDLRDVQLAPGGGRLELTALMSGVVVHLPPAWRVRRRARGLTQGLAWSLEGQDALPADAPAFDVEVLVVGAGVVITNIPDDDDPD
jgi:hypothetical protein